MKDVTFWRSQSVFNFILFVVMCHVIDLEKHGKPDTLTWVLTVFAVMEVYNLITYFLSKDE
jgi:hypothetical protein